jgi:hypothetical protein
MVFVDQAIFIDADMGLPAGKTRWSQFDVVSQ